MNEVNFPVRKITSPLSWEEVVLERQVLIEIKQMLSWLEDAGSGDNRMFKGGYRSFFYGPPGTGKTLVAAILGKTSGREVYKIDLSLAVSKYIGETEKNLNTLFDLAEKKDLILFFDEADALFGKRTLGTSNHDRYANQEVSYLLQRLEGYPGLAIVASSQKDDIDEAFLRRFQSIIYFPMPGPASRLRLWQSAFGDEFSLAAELDLPAIAEKYELSGGSISNVARFCTLAVIDRKERIISLQLIEEGIARELKRD